MSSIWNSTATQAGTGSPFATTGIAPSPGGGAAAKFQSMLAGQSSAKSPAIAPSASAASPATNAAPSTTDSGATITANDFLTLLVTEMQNQDPTAQTDPNEYINQLVQINSLEQLISINQNLSTVLGTTPASAAPATSEAAAGATSTRATSRATEASRQVPSGSVSGSGSKGNSVAGHSASRAAPGNLSIPAESPAARATAHALDGRPNAARPGHAIRDIPTHSLP